MASERRKIPVRSASEVFRCEFFRNRKRVVESTTSILSWEHGVCDRMGHAPSPTQPRPLARDFAPETDSKPPNKSALCLKRQDRFHESTRCPWRPDEVCCMSNRKSWECRTSTCRFTPVSREELRQKLASILELLEIGRNQRPLANRPLVPAQDKLAADTMKRLPQRRTNV